jgi:hypothetical protein
MPFERRAVTPHEDGWYAAHRGQMRPETIALEATLARKADGGWEVSLPVRREHARVHVQVKRRVAVAIQRETWQEMPRPAKETTPVAA